jgi:hypothetical protein
MAALIDKLDPIATTDNAADLKRRLVDHLDTLKRTNEMVRVTQVNRHHFRVNTLALKVDPDSVVQTFHIVKSQFLHVEDKLGELLITDQTRH